MDPLHERAVRQAASLAHGLVTIERAADISQQHVCYDHLLRMIREVIASADEIAHDDLERSRRIQRGDFPR